jgi:hypothetical protein
MMDGADVQVPFHDSLHACRWALVLSSRKFGRPVMGDPLECTRIKRGHFRVGS